MLEVLTKYLVHLEKAVIVVLFFIAFKMFVEAAVKASIHVPHYLHLTHTQSLYLVLGVIGLGIVASLLFPGKDEGEGEGA